MSINSLLLVNKGFQIDIYNRDHWLGGAWRRKETPYGKIATQNNIIIPLSQNEYLQLNSIANVINKLGIRCTIVPVDVNIISNYNPPAQIHLSFDDLWFQLQSSEAINIVGECTSIDLMQDSIVVNSSPYRRCYLPYRFTGIDIFNNYSPINITNTTNISHHYLFIFKSHLMPIITYTENYSLLFDRASINHLRQDIFVFVGRLRRIHKESTLQHIADHLSTMCNSYQTLHLELNKYSDSRIDNITNLMESTNDTLQVVNTDQFISSFCTLNSGC